MCTIVTELVTLYNDCKSKESYYRLSEIDTQVLFVESILKQAGWDINNPLEIRRLVVILELLILILKPTYLQNGSQFTLRLAIECKSIYNAEYNIKRLKKNDKIRALSLENCCWVNSNGDGVGQLRKYCLSFKQFDVDRTIPIFTNGFSWTVFTTEHFLDYTRLSLPIESSDVLASAEISNPTEFKRVFKYIKKEN